MQGHLEPMLERFFEIIPALILIALSIKLAQHSLKNSPPHRDWPMQWGIEGQPTWFAKRDLAAFLMPGLSLIIISLMIISQLISSLRLHDHGLGVISFIVTLGNLLVQGLHVSMVRSWFQNHPD